MSTKLTARVALPARALQRNRLLLGAFAAAAVPLAAILTAAFLAHDQQHGPLLLAIDKLELSITAPVAQRMTEAVARDLPAIEASTPSSAAQSDSAEASVSSQRWFNGRPVRPQRTMTMTVTAYSPDERSCGLSADGITASGYSVWTNGMKMAAADTAVLPLGSLISIPGYDSGNIVPVLDRGGLIKGHRLDVLYPTHERARRFGVQSLEVTLWEYADGRPSDFLPRYHRASSVAASGQLTGVR